jgi:transcriptional regulator with GAF, ATPase, and Fis domain
MSRAGGDGRSARAQETLADGTVVIVEAEGPSASDDAVTRAVRSVGDAFAPRQAAAPADEGNPGGIVGRSQPMQQLFRMLERIRGSGATVLITGENGTGKELVARTIHDHSSRKDKRFVAINCSAFNDNLLESELFGHKRGAFTGAVGDKPGLFETADGGTFLLDEVGDMSPALQVKLLRVLQEGVFMPVGATEQKKVDVRIVAATNRDLGDMVRKGTFREDLYYRLHVVHLRVPPLRERPDDIPLLVDHFLNELGERDGRRKALTSTALERLKQHHWPGNVRELENEIERVWVLSGDETVVGEQYLSPAVARASGETRDSSTSERQPSEPALGTPPRNRTLPDAVEELERRMITDRLESAKGNKTKAAELLGISRRNLIRKVQAYGLEPGGNR